jgi:hypothetical protein
MKGKQVSDNLKSMVVDAQSNHSEELSDEDLIVVAGGKNEPETSSLNGVTIGISNKSQQSWNTPR